MIVPRNAKVNGADRLRLIFGEIIGPRQDRLHGLVLLLHGQRPRLAQFQHGVVGEVCPIDVGVQLVTKDLLELGLLHVPAPDVDGADDEVGLDAAIQTDEVDQVGDGKGSEVVRGEDEGVPVLDDEVELLFEALVDSERPRLFEELETVPEVEPLADELVANVDETIHQELERDVSSVTPNRR